MMKTLKIYYKGTCQEMVAADETDADQVFYELKKIFRIPEDLKNFFFQDSEGRIVIFPKKLPNELSLFLFVRSDSNLGSNSNNPQPINPNIKWTFTCMKGTEEQLQNGTHYALVKEPSPGPNPTLVSSIRFSQGRYYFILKVDTQLNNGYVGFCSPDYTPERIDSFLRYGNCLVCAHVENQFVHINESSIDPLTKLVGIAIDFISGTAYFLKVTSTYQPTKIILKVKDFNEPVKVYAYIKSWIYAKAPHTGITLVESSLPFPTLNGIPLLNAVTSSSDIISWKNPERYYLHS